MTEIEKSLKYLAEEKKRVLVILFCTAKFKNLISKIGK